MKVLVVQIIEKNHFLLQNLDFLDVVLLPEDVVDGVPGHKQEESVEIVAS